MPILPREESPAKKHESCRGRIRPEGELSQMSFKATHSLCKNGSRSVVHGLFHFSDMLH